VTRSCVHDELHVVGRGRRRGHRVDRSRLCGHSVDRSRHCVTRSCVHRELHIGDRSLRRGTLGCVPRILARHTLDPYGGGSASVRRPDGFRTSARARLERPRGPFGTEQEPELHSRARAQRSLRIMRCDQAVRVLPASRGSARSRSPTPGRGQALREE
jgi:hypothetical protein